MPHLEQYEVEHPSTYPELNDTTLYSTGPVRDETDVLGVVGVVGELTTVVEVAFWRMNTYELSPELNAELVSGVESAHPDSDNLLANFPTTHARFSTVAPFQVWPVVVGPNVLLGWA